MNTKRSEVARQEGDVFRVTVPGKSVHVRDPDIGLFQTNRSLSFLHFGTGRADFRVRIFGSRHTFLAPACVRDLRDSRIQSKSGSQWQTDQIVELQLEIR